MFALRVSKSPSKKEVKRRQFCRFWDMGFDKCEELNSNAKLKTNLPSGKELQGLICN